MVKKIFFVLLLIIIIASLSIKNDKKTYIDNDAITILVNDYIDEEKYNNIIIYSLNNINYITKIIDIIDYRINHTNNTTYGLINKINLLKTKIVLDNSVNNNYIKLQKTIIKLSNINYLSIDEYFSVINLFNELTKLKELNLNFLEILAKKNIEITERFIKEYYGSSKNINNFVYNKYYETCKNYLSILEQKYKINGEEINNINNLQGAEFEYALIKKNLSKYKSSDTTALLVPILKTTGKTFLYYQLSKYFNKNSLATGIAVFGAVDVGTDMLGLYKKINYMLYADSLHKKNRENSLCMNKFDKIYYFISKLYYNFLNTFSNQNYFENYITKMKNTENIYKIKLFSTNRAIATILIKNKENINKQIKTNDNDLLDFFNKNILKKEENINKNLQQKLLQNHNNYKNKLKFYQNFLLDTCN